jgi:hypothetical protein
MHLGEHFGADEVAWQSHSTAASRATREQISCFFPMRCYADATTPSISLAARELNYASDYREVDGIAIPTVERRGAGSLVFDVAQHDVGSGS